MNISCAYQFINAKSFKLTLYSAEKTCSLQCEQQVELNSILEHGQYME